MMVFDHFLRFLIVMSLRNQTSASIESALIKAFELQRLPLKIVSDKGPSFTSTKFKEFCERLDIINIKCSPYHHYSNGATGRVIQTVKVFMQK